MMGIIFQENNCSGETGDNFAEVAHFPTKFNKSSYSGASQNCVEVAELPCGAAIRDSKHPDAGHLPFPASEWTTFLSTALK